MVKIYGTMGPSCKDQAVLEKMIQEGMNGMRLNLSHTTLPENRERIESYRLACQSQGVPMELMIDMRGPQTRTGFLKAPVKCFPEDKLILRARRATEEYPVVNVPPVVLSVLEPGDHLLIHDGTIELEVLEELENATPTEEQLKDPQKCATPGIFRRFLLRTLRGGVIHGQQGVHVVGKEAYGDVLTALDLETLDQAREYGVTSLMQPFVRDGSDILAVREALEERGLNLRIFAKIETVTGIEHLSSIMETADEVVIARGDLGDSMPLWELPRVQKEIARSCRETNTPFMVVTHLLQSMIRNPIPTRAEVLDIFNAVLDGCSSVMVTGESSIGHHPAEVIRYLAKTTREAEAYLSEKGNL